MEQQMKVDRCMSQRPDGQQCPDHHLIVVMVGNGKEKLDWRLHRDHSMVMRRLKVDRHDTQLITQLQSLMVLRCLWIQLCNSQVFSFSCSSSSVLFEVIATRMYNIPNSIRSDMAPDPPKWWQFVSFPILNSSEHSQHYTKVTVSIANDV